MPPTRDAQITSKHVYTTEAMQQPPKPKRVRKGDEARHKRMEAEEKRREVEDKVGFAMESSRAFRTIVEGNDDLSTFVKLQPKATKAQAGGGTRTHTL